MCDYVRCSVSSSGGCRTSAAACCALLPHYCCSLLCNAAALLLQFLALTVSSVSHQAAISSFFICFSEDPAVLEASDPDLYHNLVYSWDDGCIGTPDFIKALQHPKTSSRKSPKSPKLDDGGVKTKKPAWCSLPCPLAKPFKYAP